MDWNSLFVLEIINRKALLWRFYVFYTHQILTSDCFWFEFLSFLDIDLNGIRFKTKIVKCYKHFL